MHNTPQPPPITAKKHKRHKIHICRKMKRTNKIQTGTVCLVPALDPWGVSSSVIHMTPSPRLLEETCRRGNDAPKQRAPGQGTYRTKSSLPKE